MSEEQTRLQREYDAKLHAAEVARDAVLQGQKRQQERAEKEQRAQEQATRDRLAKLQAEQERETMAAAAEQHTKRERGYYVQLTRQHQQPAARSFVHAAPAGPAESEAPSVVGAGFRILDSSAESTGDDFDSDLFGLREEHPTGQGLENCIALRVLSVTLKRDSPHLDSLSVDSVPLTFLGAEFFDFETAYSEVYAGWTPRYAFTTLYTVAVDKFLRAHLEIEQLVVTLYQPRGGTDFRKVAQAFLPLRGLLSPAAGVEVRTQLIHLGTPAGDTRSEDVGGGGVPSNDAVVGELRYMLRMRQPIVSTPASPAGSRGGTPVRGMSRAGSIIGAEWSTGAGQQQQQTAAAQAAAQHERDIQDLLNNPEAQAGLFGNNSGQSTAREGAV
jgi:hypothetical protein